MRHSFRLGRGARWLPALGATVALAVVPSVASADGGSNGYDVHGAANPTFDPEYTNTPYLAWTGESVRLEKCIPNPGLTVGDLNQDGATATFQLEGWTGDHTDVTTAPQLTPSTVKLFISHDYRGQGAGEAGGICAEGDYIANTPGLARIELDVDANTVNNGKAGHGPVYAALAHQFIAAWMNLNTPSLTHMGSSAFDADPQNDPTKDYPTTINDPGGTGATTAGDTPAYLGVKVTGTFPLTGNPAIEAQVGSSSITLPQDWALLASKLAVDFTPNNGTAWSQNAADDWDTSGDPRNEEGHVSGECATDNNPFNVAFQAGDAGTYGALDNGDNCGFQTDNGVANGNELGPFSTATGELSSNDTIGPYDPTDPADTSLPDGDLNAYDAPMPAALIDVKMAPNSAPTSTTSTDTSGIGSLQAANKTQTYSRDFTGAPTAHNLYAPFYDAYIPATARPTDNSSGIDGAFGNDFTGFLDIPGGGFYTQYGAGLPGEYHFWDTADLHSYQDGTSNCLNYSRDDNPEGQQGDASNVYRSGASGNDEVDVYTDQNGEAQVEYVPGDGAFFDRLGADKNADGGCDLQGISTLGSAAITATAEYPYKPTNFPQMKSATVTETVHSLFDTALRFGPTGTSPADSNERIVIAHAQDIDGTPYGDEAVCFSADKETEGITRFAGYVNGVYYGDTSLNPGLQAEGLGRLCLNTDENGNAAVAVLNSNMTATDVIADYVDEGLLRDISVDFSDPSSTGGTPPTGPVTQPPANPTVPVITVDVPKSVVVATAPTLAKVDSINPRLAGALKKSHKVQLTKLKSVQLFSPLHGHHYLVIRVNSKSRSARVVITMRVRSGSRYRTIHRTLRVKTNRNVKVNVSKSVSQIKGARLAG